MDREQREHRPAGRRRWPRVLAALGALLALVLLWGVAIEPRLVDEVHQTVRLPRLPSAWEGARVALIADLQVGLPLDNSDTVARVVQRLLDERPAAVLIGGDFILGARPRQEAAEIAALLRPLGESDIPTFAVLGNHDYGQRHLGEPPRPEVAALVEGALESVGIQVLRNEAVPLSRPGAEPLYVVGIDSFWAERSRPEVALSGVPPRAPRVVLMHNPRSFTALPSSSAPLALAAHTHGGQVRLPLLPDWSWLTFIREDEVHTDGWIHDYGAPGNRLYVNRGIGFSEVPLRINCPPELTYFELRASAPQGEPAA